MKKSALVTFLFLIALPLASSNINDWERFESPIQECDGVCTLEDDFSLDFGNDSLTIDTGSTGYCGVGGVARNVSLYENPSLQLEAKAYIDSWGGNPGVKVDDEWVYKFDFAGGGSFGTSDWRNLDLSLANYSGQNATVKLVAQDLSSEWCNMGDHSMNFQVRNVELDGTAKESESAKRLCEDCSPPQDPDGDGLYEDANGDGETSVEDVNLLVRNSQGVKSDERFEFVDATESVFVGSRDIVSLYDEVNDKAHRGLVVELPHSPGISCGIFEENGENCLRIDSIQGEEASLALETDSGEQSFTITEGMSLDTDRGTIKAVNIVSLSEEDGSVEFSTDSDIQEKEIDISDLEAEFSDARVVLPEEGEETETEIARDLAGNLSAGTLSANEVEGEERRQNLILVGGPAINSLSEEISSEKDEMNLPDIQEGDFIIRVVPDALEDGYNAVIISGYSSEELRSGVLYFQRLMREESERDTHEDHQLLTISIADYSSDLIAENLNVSRDEDEYRIVASIRNTGEEVETELEFEGEEFEENLDHGLNVIQRNLEPEELGQAAAQISSQESVTFTIGETDHSFTTTAVDSANQAGLRVDGELMEVSEGDTFRLDGKIVRVSRIIKTGRQDEGRVLIHLGDDSDFARTVELEVDPEDEIQESDEDNNRLTASMDLLTDPEPISSNVFEVRLHEGWNMVSGPAIESTDGFKAGTLADQCSLREYNGETFWKYEDGRWEHGETIGFTESVFVNANEPCTAEVRDTWSSDMTSAPWNVLEEGWNMISVEEEKTLEQASGTCEFEKYRGSEVWSYEGDGEWSKLGPGDQLDPSKGYYVKSEGECTMGYSTNQGPPTPSGNFFEQATGWLK
jgi:hypothetical protein